MPPGCSAGRRSLDLPGVFGGLTLHGTDYRGSAPFAGRRVAVVGHAFSGCKIATDLALGGACVTSVAGRPMWLASRWVEREGRRVPWDVAAYRRSERDRDRSVTPSELNRRRARRYDDLGGNPGRLHPRLWLDPDSAASPHITFAELLPGLVDSGAVTVEPGRAVPLTTGAVVLDSGVEIACDAVIWCTGYRPDVGLLGPERLRAVGFDPEDRLQPLLLHRCTWNPDVPGVAFTGLYRGPYFGVMELQARCAAAVFSGRVPAPGQAGQRAGLAEEMVVRQLRPQFPHPDYIGLADAIAGEIDALPSRDERGEPDDDPVVPAQYRLRGPGAQPQEARRRLASVRRRLYG